MKDKIVFLVLLLFFLHGAFYFLFPERVFDVSFWQLKIVKYVLFVLYFILTIRYVNLLICFFCLLYLILLCVLCEFSHSLVTASFYMGNMNFYLPILLLCNAYKLSDKKVSNIVDLVCISAIIMAIIEYLFLKDIMIFNNQLSNEGNGYYRVVSLFVNPNGLGLMMSLFVIYYMEYGNVKHLKKYILLTMCFVTLLFSASKSAILFLIMFYFVKFIVIVFKLGRVKVKNIIIVLFVVSLMAIVFNLDVFRAFLLEYNIRTYDTGTMDERLIKYMSFIKLVDVNFVFPELKMITGFNGTMTADSSFMQIWADFGFWGMVIYYMSIFLCLYPSVSVNKLSLVLSFIFISFVVKVTHLWPLSYLLFYILSYDFLKGYKNSIVISRKNDI